MQPKRRYSRPMVLFMMLLGLSSGVLIVMLSRDIAPPQQPVQKPLDAKVISQ